MRRLEKMTFRALEKEAAIFGHAVCYRQSEADTSVLVAFCDCGWRGMSFHSRKKGTKPREERLRESVRKHFVKMIDVDAADDLQTHAMGMIGAMQGVLAHANRLEVNVVFHIQDDETAPAWSGVKKWIWKWTGLREYEYTMEMS